MVAFVWIDNAAAAEKNACQKRAQAVVYQVGEVDLPIFRRNMVGAANLLDLCRVGNGEAIHRLRISPCRHTDIRFQNRLKNRMKQRGDKLRKDRTFTLQNDLLPMERPAVEQDAV